MSHTSGLVSIRMTRVDADDSQDGECSDAAVTTVRRDSGDNEIRVIGDAACLTRDESVWNGISRMCLKHLTSESPDQMFCCTACSILARRAIKRGSSRVARIGVSSTSRSKSSLGASPLNEAVRAGMLRGLRRGPMMFSMGSIASLGGRAWMTLVMASMTFV